MKVHCIKINSEFSPRLAKNNKRCEISKNDRDYKVGDLLLITDETTGEIFYRMITDVILHYEIPEGLRTGYVALSVLPLSHSVFKLIERNSSVQLGEITTESCDDEIPFD